MLDEQQFRMYCDQALQSLQRSLVRASEEFGFESDINSGALSVEFEESREKFVVSPQTPVRQVWVSAHSKSFKLGWDDARKAFVLPETGETLEALIAGQISKQLGEEVTL